MKQAGLIALFLTACLWSRAAGTVLSLIPQSEITEKTASLEAAYPGQMEIDRAPCPRSDLVYYTIRIYDPGVLDVESWGGWLRIALVVCDAEGTELSRSNLEFSGLSERPPDKRKFRSFSFAVHESLERTTMINIGRLAGWRMSRTPYKLPLRSIPHPTPDTSIERALEVEPGGESGDG